MFYHLGKKFTATEIAELMVRWKLADQNDGEDKWIMIISI
jgi:hypothetical protein